jgi:hypothetical protein
LHAHEQVVPELEKIETRDRRLGNVGLKLGRLEKAGARPCLSGGNELLDDPLGFAQLGGAWVVARHEEPNALIALAQIAHSRVLKNHLGVERPLCERQILQSSSGTEHQ